MDLDSEYEEYLDLCGELYLTVKGNIVIHCLLCDNIYKCFKDYAAHTKIHYQEYDNDDTSPDTEKNYSQTDFQIKEETEEYEESKSHIIESPPSKPTPADHPNVLKNESPKIQDKTLKNSNNEQMTRSQRRKLQRARDVGKYKCPHCSFACNNSSNLNTHVKRHSMEKPHKCTQCPKAFYSRSERDTHIRSHTGEKPFLCSICGQSFVTCGILTTHRKRHDNIRDKKCPKCNYTCYDTSTLKKHLLIHSERNFKCPQCEASFKARVALWNHIKIHENKREYACKLCESKFNQLAALYSHMKSTHMLAIGKN